MKNLFLTPSSSAPFGAEYANLSPDFQRWISDVRTDQQQRQAKDAATGARGLAARKVLIEAGVTKAINDHRAGVARTRPCGRVTYVLERIQNNPEAYGLKVKPDGSCRYPERETIQKILWEMGFSTRNDNN